MSAGDSVRANRKKGTGVDGRCCACGYDEPDETACPKREDETHCVHWWDGPNESENIIMTKLSDNVIEACARAAHEVNRAYCLALGDTSQPAWEAAPEWQRSSAVNGVSGVLNEGNGPEQSHESWLAEKRAAGWKFGPVKDPEKKEHPCFVPYAELPASQRKKDDLFVSTVYAVAEALGG